MDEGLDPWHRADCGSAPSNSEPDPKRLSIFYATERACHKQHKFWLGVQHGGAWDRGCWVGLGIEGLFSPAIPLAPAPAAVGVISEFQQFHLLKGNPQQPEMLWDWPIISEFPGKGCAGLERRARRGPSP